MVDGHILSTRKYAHNPSFFLWALGFLGAFIAAIISIHLYSLRDPSDLLLISLEDVINLFPSAILFFVVGFVFVKRRWGSAGGITLFLIAYWMRVFVGIFLASLFQYDDEIGFHLKSEPPTWNILLFTPRLAYHHLTDLLYAVFGANILVPKAFNALVGSLLPFLVYDLGYRLFESRRVASWAMIFTAFLPPLVVYSGVNLKEILTAFGFVAIIWFLGFDRPFTVGKIVGLAALLAFLYWLRGPVWAMIGMVGIVCYVFLERERLFEEKISFALPLVFLILFIISIGILFIYNPIEIYDKPFIEGLDSFQSSRAQVSQYLDISSPFAIKNQVVLFLRALYSPTPLSVVLSYGIGKMIESLNMLSWYLLFPLALIGALSNGHKSAVIVAALIILGVYTMAAVGVTFLGEIHRHRMPVMGLVSVMAAGGLQLGVLRKYGWIVLFWWLGALIFNIWWTVLRIF